MNYVLPTFFTLRNEAKEIVAVLSSNVDDLLYGFMPEAEGALVNILKEFSVGKEEMNEFRFCGKEIVQHEDFGIRVTAKDNTEKIAPIGYDKKRKLTDKCTAGETTQLRSVTAALAWVARQVRPRVSYRVSRMQGLMQVATVQELREANAILSHAKETSNIGIYFSPDGPDWNEAVVCSIGDASFGNEVEIINGEKEGDRSQQGYVIVLAPPDILNAETAIVHPIIWSSTTIKRVCRATLMAEAFSMTNAEEQGARIRAAVVDAKGELNRKNWEESAAASMSHVWLTDCDSLYEHLISSKMKHVANKGLAIDLKAL